MREITLPFPDSSDADRMGLVRKRNENAKQARDNPDWPRQNRSDFRTLLGNTDHVSNEVYSLLAGNYGLGPLHVAWNRVKREDPHTAYWILHTLGIMGYGLRSVDMSRVWRSMEHEDRAKASAVVSKVVEALQAEWSASI